MEKPAQGTPRQEISMAEELAKVEALEEKARTHQKFIEQRDTLCETITDNGKRIEAKQAEIKELQEQIKSIEREINNIHEDNAKITGQIDTMIAPEEIKPEQIIEARKGLLAIEEKNKAIRRALEFDKAIESLEAAKKEVARLEEGMMKIDLEKQNKIKSAKFPIDGLGMTDEFVTYQSMPFSQLSTGEQIRVSTAVAMSLNPTLKIILVREGSLLDKEGRKEMIKIAKERDYQLWLECVSDDKGVGIYLEDGAIKE
jgi:chromosome segregation ATPase